MAGSDIRNSIVRVERPVVVSDARAEEIAHAVGNRWLHFLDMYVYLIIMFSYEDN